MKGLHSICERLISVACGLGLAVVAPNLLGAAGDAQIEEVVVTGSYLKTTAADSPSPLSVVSAADIADLGAADIAEVVQTLPWQSGSQTRTTTFSGEGADGRASINLRNMGHGATLVLVNGRRQVKSWYNPRGNASVNVNALIPNIAIERVEIVKDGAAALYGSDAIAGVVNFITDRNFQGFDFNYQWSTDSETGKGDANRAGVKFGVQGDRGGVVVSAGVLKRKEININDRYSRFGGSSASGTGQPGRFNPVDPSSITRPDGSVQDDGTAIPYGPTADLDCANAAAADGKGGTLGSYFDVLCAYDFGSFFALQANESLRQFHVNGYYAVTDAFEVNFEFAANDSRFDRLNSLNPNAPALTIPITHLGNIEDAARRNIAPTPVRNVTRMVGYTAGDPNRPVDTFTNTDRKDQRLAIGGTWDVQFMGRPWQVNGNYTASDHDSATSQVQDTLSSHMQLAIIGLGGPNCDRSDPANIVAGDGNLAYAMSDGDFGAGNCYYFNPFGNSRFDRDGNPQTDGTLINPPELYQWLLGRVTNDENYRLRVIDLVASGDLMDVPGGTAQLAVGYQRRRNTGEVIFDAAANTGNLDFAFGARDWRGDLTTNALFAELSVPVTNMLNVNAAVRYEGVKELGKKTVNPKLTMLFRPVDALSMRASWGSSFKVPSLQQLYGSLTTVANQADLASTAFRPSITVGNSALKPEKASNFNIGASWQPSGNMFEGFQADIDYYNYRYKNIITREASANLLAADNQAIRTALGLGPTDDVDPTAVPAVIAAGVGNRQQVIRSGGGTLLRILPNFVNADSANISGLDATISYRFDTALGMLRLGFAGSYVMNYEIKAGGQTFDGVGQYNVDINPVARPLPQYKFNATVNWAYGNHSAFALIMRTPSLDYGIDLNTDPRAGAARFWRGTRELAFGPGGGDDFFTRKIEAMTTANLSYTYSFSSFALLSDSRLTLGINNVANTEPPYVPVNTGFDATLHDPRGRMWFARVSGSL